MVVINDVEMACALIGGAIIGVATTVNLATYGRITGNSGIFNSLVKFNFQEGFRWKFSFLAGLVASTYLLYLMSANGVWHVSTYAIRLFDSYPQSYSGLNTTGWIIGGILVGVGTRMGNGCTSGHGVCGIPRLSMRSIVAVCTFMASGIAVATIRHYSPFLNETQSFGTDFEATWEKVGGALALLTTVVFIAYSAKVYSSAQLRNEKLEMPVSWIVGFLFGLGLVVSGMCRRSKILGFLTLSNSWDPSLMLVMVGAIGVNIFTFQILLNKIGRPCMAPTFSLVKNSTIDTQLIAGAAIFGLGWGLSGLCPGPGMVNFFNMTHCAIWIPALAVGQIGYDKLSSMLK